MKHIPHRRAAVYRRDTDDINRTPVVVREYETGNENINVAEVVLRAGTRYPEKGFAVNDKVDMVVYIATGECLINTENDSIPLVMGDVIEISRGEKYFWKATTTAVLVPASHPAWTVEQHRYVE
jgi:hypothetical protein